MDPGRAPREKMNVAAIRNGTVIDHIQNEATFKVAEILQLARSDQVVLVGMNLRSSRGGCKGIVKIEDRELTAREVSTIALIAPQATLNIIKDYRVVEKRRVELPRTVEGIVRCFNPSCITNCQNVATRFDVLASNPVSLRCSYCERLMSGPDIVLK
ncbi:MAG: aspartate carbamoyltransferase regulatory subunit [Candidatus Brocadiaceae bacterium]|nr:aspartate carbamoyltransferase regulatory subunit [Candidatus Brocadiaceae bacterium]